MGYFLLFYSMEYIFDCCQQQLKRKKTTLKILAWGSFNKNQLEKIKLLEMFWIFFWKKKILLSIYIFSCILWWGL